MKPERGDEVLRRFRISQPHTDYFLTFCTSDRQSGLTVPIAASALRAEIEQIESDGYWTIRGAVIMPDHLHLLATLHDKHRLSRVIARFKSKTRPTLAATGLRWQGNYYEHRLRETDGIEGVLLYIFLNPYRAGLLVATESYPCFWLGAMEAVWFKPQLDEGKPFADWLR
jgi:REP element-mobilizing transposase RayT